MPDIRKWQKLGNLGFLQQEEKTAEEAPSGEKAAESVGHARPPPPQSAKPPPTKPPSTYANDKPRLDSISETEEKGAIKGKGKEKGKARGQNDTAVGKKGSK